MADRVVKSATGTGEKIETFTDDAKKLQADDFEELHGVGFLLLTATGFKRDAGGTSTEMILLDEPDDGGDRTAGVSVLVFPLRPGASAQTHLVTAGRTSKSDVVIPDISVSRFHAYFKCNKAGVWQVLDAGSTNGTTVNNVSVSTKGSGPPSDLKPGDSVRLGQMDLTFIDATALRDYALKFE